MLFNKLSFLDNSPMPPTALLVGGPIFFIDSTASGATYTFYDLNGARLTDVQPGDTPYAYTVSGTPSKDKYYVYNNSLITDKRWTYVSDGWPVYNALGTLTDVGSGKNNTGIVMAADDGKYVTQISGGETIWSAISNMRTTSVGGRDDWYVPSKDETDRLRTAVDRDGFSLVSWFRSNSIWTSSEDTQEDVHDWVTYYGGTWLTASKYDKRAVFGIRSF